MLTAAALSSFSLLLLLASAGRVAPTRAPVPRDRSPRAPVWKLRHGRHVVVAAVALASMVVAGPTLTIGVSVGALYWPRVRRAIELRRRQAAIDASLPDAIEMLILVVRAGMTPHQAVTMLTERSPAAVRHAFTEVDRRRGRGATLADALQALPELLGTGAAVVADTLAMAERYGTPIADALEQLSSDVRERRARQSEADARKLPIRMSFPLVVCTLPAFVLIAIVPAVLGALSSLDTTGF